MHLSLTKERALEVARRRGGPHVILRIRARELAASQPIYRPSRLTFLARKVPPEYIEMEEVLGGYLGPGHSGARRGVGHTP